MPFSPVSKQNPCPACNHDSWCTATSDNQRIKYMRTDTAPVGWRTAGPAADGGVFFVRTDCAYTSPPSNNSRPKPAAKKDWAAEASRYRSNLKPGQLKSLASQLGVTEESLTRLGVGFGRINDSQGSR